MRPGGARAIVAESLLVKQQLLIVTRSRRRAPDLRPLDRVVAGLCAGLTALVPRPRLNLTRFHGVFAPNCKHRQRIVPRREPEQAKPSPSPAPMTWMQRLKRVFAIEIETCPKCGVRCVSSPAGKRDQLFMAVLRQAGDPVRVADVVSALDMNRFAASKLQALAGRRTQERTSAVTPIQQFGWLRRRHVFTAGRHSSVGRAAYSKNRTSQFVYKSLLAHAAGSRRAQPAGRE